MTGKRNNDAPQPLAWSKEGGKQLQEKPAVHELHPVQITHADKVFCPAEGYTKGDLIEYYETIAPWMLPYLKDRPAMLTRYPYGIDGHSLFPTRAAAYAPTGIHPPT